MGHRKNKARKDKKEQKAARATDATKELDEINTATSRMKSFRLWAEKYRLTYFFVRNHFLREGRETTNNLVSYKKLYDPGIKTRCIMDIIVNYVVVQLLLNTVPLTLLGTTDAMDFVKDCLAIAFIVTLDGSESDADVMNVKLSRMSLEPKSAFVCSTPILDMFDQQLKERHAGFKVRAVNVVMKHRVMDLAPQGYTAVDDSTHESLADVFANFQKVCTENQEKHGYGMSIILFTEGETNSKVGDAEMKSFQGQGEKKTGLEEQNHTVPPTWGAIWYVGTKNKCHPEKKIPLKMKYALSQLKRELGPNAFDPDKDFYTTNLKDITYEHYMRTRPSTNPEERSTGNEWEREPNFSFLKEITEQEEKFEEGTASALVHHNDNNDKTTPLLS